MEAHPVPQNVTAFEFHLVGNMTVRQFIYLAVGLGFAYLLFVTIASIIPVIAWPLIAISGLSGVAFAFVPIAERPLDHWLNAFMKSVFSPTQREWNSKLVKDKKTVLENRLFIYLNSLAGKETPLAPLRNQPNLSIMSQFAPTTQPIVSQPTHQTPPPSASVVPQPASSPQPTPSGLAPTPQASEKPAPEPLPTSTELSQTVELAKKAQEVQARIVNTEHELNQIKVRAAAPGVNPKEFAPQFQKILGELQNLTAQASEVSSQMAILSKAPQVKPVQQPITTTKKPVVANIVLTQTPNIVNGIVTDANNTYLEGVIVVTHNKEGLPVRALKTNKLGQFVAATPLPNGVYTIALEKDALVFDNIQITLEGKTLPPIVISAKQGGAAIAN